MYLVGLIQRLSLLLLLSLVVFSSANASLAATVDSDIPFYNDGNPPNFFFLGSSYFYENFFPSRFFKSFIEKEVPSWKDDLKVVTSNFPNRNWRAQLLDPITRFNFLARKYKWVFLLERSYIPLRAETNPDDFDDSVKALRRLHNLAQNSGAQTLVVMTWGHRKGGDFGSYPAMQHTITKAFYRYRDELLLPDTSTSTAATSRHGGADIDDGGSGQMVYFAPVGLVFQTIYENQLALGITDPQDSTNLFSDLFNWDGRHPSIEGSYAMLLTIYATITGRSPQAVGWCPESLYLEKAIEIQEAVSRTILKTYNSGEIKYPWDKPFQLFHNRQLQQGYFDLNPDNANSCYGEGVVTVVVDITSSNKPLELAWSVSWEAVHDNSGSKYYYRSDGDGTNPPSNTQTFEGIRNGEELAFRILLLDDIDSFVDPEASVDVTILDKDDNIVWSAPNNFLTTLQQDRFLEVMLAMGSRGKISEEDILVSHSTQPAAWIELESDIWRPRHKVSTKASGWWWDDAVHPLDDALHLKKTPNVPFFSLTVAVHPDNAPAETSWELSKYNFHFGLDDIANDFSVGSSGEWMKVSSWNGTEAISDGTGKSVYKTWLEGLEKGWYRLIVRDSGKDGMQNGEGYVTVAGRVSDEKLWELIWGTNGHFYDQAEIYFSMEWHGAVQRVAWSEKAAIQEALADMKAMSWHCNSLLTRWPTNVLSFLLTPFQKSERVGKFLQYTDCNHLHN